VKRVLAFGMSQTTLEKGLALLRAGGFEAEGALDAEKIIAALTQSRFDLLVIGGGVGKIDRAAVKKAAQNLAVSPKIIEVHGVHNLMAAVLRTVE
jgi:hypothetical protein